MMAACVLLRPRRADMEPQADRRIVVGVDGSESSVGALEWAAQQAEYTGAKLQVVTTWEWPTTYGGPVPYSNDWDPTADAEKVITQAVEPLRKQHPNVEVETTVAEGHAAPALVDASRGADLLVVGSRGHGEFVGMLLGSVSEHCVTNAHCPVLVYRHDD
jgi:nucleotide-binding universal stress UspA family protein